MAKRIIIRVGAVFCVEIDNEYKCFFQYVGRDRTQMGSDVIRVFKTRYPAVYEPLVDEIVKDEVSFYSHTFLRLGVQEQVWNIIGMCKDVGDTENISFRLFDDSWYVWKINGKYQYVDEMTDEIQNFDFGWVFPYKEILRKIETGHYSSWLEFDEHRKI